jgi:poly-gamma-glutamate system protein
VGVKVSAMELFPIRMILNLKKRNRRGLRIVVSGIASLAAYLAIQLPSPGNAPRDSDVIVKAGRIMETAMSAIRSRRPGVGTVFDQEVDPNQTGLIGPEYSPLMTSLGQLQSKRSTTNPNMAGLIVHLLYRAGVSAGDTVAIGSSGSFPALLVASLAAASAMEVHPVCILSLGASSYGATDTEFDLLDVYTVLQRSGICSNPPAAVSLGGEKDVGLDFEPEFRERLIRKIKNQGVPFIYEPDLAQNVAQRILIYQSNAAGRVAAFINSGGGYANLGTSPLALELKPGLNACRAIPPKGARGVLFEMAAQNTPVIHLLYIKGLTQRFGLPWDPIPLPTVGPAKYGEAQIVGARFWIVCVSYFGLLLLLIVTQRTPRRSQPGQRPQPNQEHPVATRH